MLREAIAAASVLTWEGRLLAYSVEKLDFG
jgi:hypothetical protein